MHGACDTGSENGESRGMHVAVDIYGDVYHAGVIWRNGHIGPFQFVADGGTSDISLVKYKSNGEPIWALFGSTKAFTQGLVPDPFGNIYVSGVYHDTAFVFGGEVLYNPLAPDSLSSFIAKIDSGGHIIWLKNVGDIRNAGYTSSYGNGIASDNCGNLYFLSAFSNDFTVNANSYLTLGRNDLFVAKFDTSGSFIWGKAFGGSDQELTAGISLSKDGNIVIAGSSASDTLIIGDTLMVGSTIPQVFYQYGGFIAMLDAMGDPIWARGTYGSASTFIAGVATDRLGNSFVVGGYGAYDTTATMFVDTDQLPSVAPFTEHGFIAKFDSLGDIDWLKSIVSNRVHAKNVATDECNNVWLAGANFDNPNSIIYDTVDGNVVMMPIENNGATFLSGWSNNGAYLTTSSLSTGSYNSVEGGLTTDKNGDLFLSGVARVDTFFLSGDSLYNANGYVAFGGYPHNMFVAKYNTGFNCTYTPPAPCWPASINATSSNDQTLNIYPNPTHENLTIETTISKYTLTIFNTLGQQVYAKRNCGNKETVNVQGFAPGVYHLRIDEEGGEVMYRKVVVE